MQHLAYMNPRDFDGDDESKSFPGPQRPQSNPVYKFSPDELRVMRECNKESFWRRCVPFMALLGGGAYVGVHTGYFKKNPKYGATPKVVVSVIIAYFVGRFSYQTKCAEKLMQLPNSQLGEMLRQRRKGFLQDTLDPGFGPSMSLAPFSSATDQYSDLTPQNSYDMDTTRPQYEGLDDSHRPTIDNPIYEEEMPPVQKYSTSYEELRKKNRDEYQQQRLGSYRSPDPKPQQPPTSTAKPLLEPEVPQGRTNKYGDPWG